jgi:hypothetical protein
MEVIVRQTITSGSTVILFEVLQGCEVLQGRSLDSDMPGDAQVLREAQHAVYEAQRALLEAQDFLTRTFMGPLMSQRDRFAETQAMVRAFVGVVFPDVVLY